MIRISIFIKARSKNRGSVYFQVIFYVTSCFFMVGRLITYQPEFIKFEPGRSYWPTFNYHFLIFNKQILHCCLRIKLCRVPLRVDRTRVVPYFIEATYTTPFGVALCESSCGIWTGHTCMLRGGSLRIS